MKKWEYLVESEKEIPLDASITSILDEYGEQGWELISYGERYSPQSGKRYFRVELKREKQNGLDKSVSMFPELGD